MSKENSLEFGRNFPHFRSASSILHDRQADVEHLRPDGGEEEELNFSPETWLLVIVAIGTVLGVMATILLVRHREHCGARWLVPIAGVVFGFVGAIWVILKQRYAGREKTCTHRVAAQLGTPYFEIACSVFGFVWTLAAMVEVDSGPRVCRKASETGRALLAAQSAVMVVLCVLSVTMGVSRILTGSYRALIEAGVRGVRYCCCWMGLIRPWRRRRSAKYAHVVNDGDGVRLVIRTVGDPAGEQPAGTVRFVCVSDTHRQHRELRLPDGDVLVHAGDVLFRDRGTVGVPPYRGANDGREVIQELNTWAGELLDKHAFEWIVVVGGNHDLWLEEQGAGQAQSLLSNVQYLCDSSVALSFGESLVTVYGSPVSVGGRSLNRAFQHEAESEELKRVWDHIPDDIDVVVTHSMPSILRPSSSKADVALSKRLASVRPALAVSGHVHLAHGVAEAHGTVFVGAASCNNYYMPVNLPIVVDVELPGSVQLEPV
ncbi:metallophosphoesterase [Thecamonas trahens ATCC 50062]|uniref:Metallophosphoesterase n=1 Tax=Thecamonas trahens ATCC 50062 TaxID=461836 RepID=A0A0L0D4W4_THETB|nr:metallophosphoesterase [Thecamonas trahens ATCC 50062]KNC47369.1 metallophosphoesterase [Thecamonas trahens ATCC 50062]|eukprot:XP_013759707.1 metallophosphoesterase [Thecamonas trahens ATCC 50062]